MAANSSVSFRAIISHEGDEKYVVASIKNKVSGKEQLMVVSHPVQYHSQIASHLEDNINQNEALTIQGGGILKIDRNRKHIHTYGMSGGFGKPDESMVRQILSSSSGYQEYTLDITVTDYVRG